MNFLRNVLTRNSLRPVWWTGNDTLEDFGGVANLRKAIIDADHNVTIAGRAFAKAIGGELEALRKANDVYDQAVYNRAILEGIVA